MKGLSWKTIATYTGVLLIALALIDTAVHHWNGVSFGRGVKSQPAGESALVFLMLGLIIGLLGGVILAFSYFMWKERQLAEKPDELEELLNELSKEEALFIEEHNTSAFDNDDKNPDLEPWERPTDWWKQDED